MWNDNTVSQNDSSSIACKPFPIYSVDHIGFSFLANILKALPFNADHERNFNEHLLVSLGFVKVRRNLLFFFSKFFFQDEKTGRQRRTINQRDKIFKTLVDINQYLPKSTKNLLSVFLQNTS
jgi:hypothetical protein